ncbi:hypothetical protein ER45_028890 (plasmid) [Bacillus mycoides]|nr:hypothetical protein ER45_028890 [Bacillus mycoides]
MRKELEPFLPTAEELEKMDRIMFYNWIEEARVILKKREQMRDPLVHLQQIISHLLHAEGDLTEAERELSVQKVIEAYYKANILG